MRQSENVGFNSSEKTRRPGGRAAAIRNVIGQTRTTDADAEVAISTLEFELKRKEAAISRLLSEDVRNTEEIAELQRLIWNYHRALPNGCTCDICLEVEQGQAEIEGLIS